MRRAVFLVTKAGLAEGPISAKYTTVDDTAKAGLDYIAKSATLVFDHPNQFFELETIQIDVKGDRVDEPNEAFVVTFTEAAGATILEGTGRALIIDDDPRGH